MASPHPIANVPSGALRAPRYAIAAETLASLSGIGLTIGVAVTFYVFFGVATWDANESMWAALVGAGVALFFLSWPLGEAGSALGKRWLLRSRRGAPVRFALAGSVMTAAVALLLSFAQGNDWQRAVWPTGGMVEFPNGPRSPVSWFNFARLRFLRLCDRSHCELSIAGPGESLPDRMGADPFAMRISPDSEVVIRANQPLLSPGARAELRAMDAYSNNVIVLGVRCIVPRVPLRAVVPWAFMGARPGLLVALVALARARSHRTHVAALKAGRAATLGPDGLLVFADGSPTARIDAHSDAPERSVVVKTVVRGASAGYRIDAPHACASWFEGDRVVLIGEAQDRISALAIFALMSLSLGLTPMIATWVATR